MNRLKNILLVLMIAAVSWAQGLEDTNADGTIDLFAIILLVQIVLDR